MRIGDYEVETIREIEGIAKWDEDKYVRMSAVNTLIDLYTDKSMLGVKEFIVKRKVAALQAEYDINKYWEQAFIASDSFVKEVFSKKDEEELPQEFFKCGEAIEQLIKFSDVKDLMFDDTKNILDFITNETIYCHLLNHTTSAFKHRVVEILQENFPKK